MTDFHLRLKQETVDSIKELAEKESRSVSGMARKILEDYFKTGYDPMKTEIQINSIDIKPLFRRK